MVGVLLANRTGHTRVSYQLLGEDRYILEARSVHDISCWDTRLPVRHVGMRDLFNLCRPPHYSVLVHILITPSTTTTAFSLPASHRFYRLLPRRSGSSLEDWRSGETECMGTLTAGSAPAERWSYQDPPGHRSRTLAATGKIA